MRAPLCIAPFIAAAASVMVVRAMQELAYVAQSLRVSEGNSGAVVPSRRLIVGCLVTGVIALAPVGCSRGSPTTFSGEARLADSPYWLVVYPDDGSYLEVTWAGARIETCMWEEATERIVGLVEGRDVVVERSPMEYHYFVWVDGQLVNDILLAEGLAGLGPGAGEFSERFEALKNQAFTANVGAWGKEGCFSRPRSYCEKLAEEFTFQAAREYLENCMTGDWDPYGLRGD